MAFAADFSRGNPTGPGEFDVLRRRRAHEGIYSLSLVAGCLLGIAISWQAVLSESARERLVAGLFGVGEDVAALPPPAAIKPAILSRTSEGPPMRRLRP